MKFVYDNCIYTGTREEIIEALRDHLKNAQLWCSRNLFELNFSLCEERYSKCNISTFNVEDIKETLIQKAVEKIPIIHSTGCEISIYFSNGLYSLLVDDEQVVKSYQLFTINQILKYCDTNITLKPDVQVHISDSYRLWLDNVMVVQKDRKIRLSTILYYIFNRANK